MYSRNLANFVDPGTLAGIWSAVSLVGAIAALLLGFTLLRC